MGSLDDLAGSGEPTQSTGRIAFMRKASEESKRRNQTFGQEIWRPVWDARGKAFPFKMSKNSSAKVVLLNDGIPVLAHKVFIGWAKTAEGSFPRRENVRCTALRLDKEGNWISTGKDCKLCTFFGRDPRLLVLWGLLDLRSSKKKDGRYQVCRMEVDSETIMGSIWNGVEIRAQAEGGKASTKFAMFHVARSGERTSYSHGNSWTFDRWITGDLLNEVQPYLDLLPDWKKGWPIFDEEMITEIARRHLSICEEHNLTDKGKGAPSREGVLAVLGKDGAAKVKSKSGSGESSEKSGSSLDDLAGEESPKEEPKKDTGGPNLDSLEDLEDIGGSSTGDDEPSENGGDPDEESGDGFDPWMDGDV